MQRNEHASEECLVLLFERKSETVDDGSKNLQQLSDTVVALRLIDELEEDIVDRSSDECSKIEEFAINSVKRGFKKVALSWVFAVKKLQQLRA